MKFKTISVADSKKLIKESKPMILDCRDMKDYRAGHLEDALHVHEGLKESLVKRGDKQRSLLIYCYYGHASEHLAEFFSDFGFKNVYSLAGGYSSWKEHPHQEIEMQALPRELALRIALASRILPGIDIARLLEILHERVGSPLDDEKLKSITVTNLKTGLGSLDGEEDGEDICIGLANIKLAVRYLWGDEAEDEDLPEILPYREGDMPDSIRVAIGSNSGALINGHFGSCIRFLIYQLSEHDCRLVDIRSTIEADSSDDRNLFRANLIKDCHVMFVQSIGGPAAAKVIRADIYPIKVPEVTEALDQLKEFQKVFAAPPPWFAKVLGRSAEERVRFAHDEGC